MQLTPLQDKTITEIFEQPMRSGKSTLIALLVLLDPSAEDVVKYMKARMRGIPIGERNEHKH